MILAIDPGTYQSGYCVLKGGAVVDHGVLDNDDTLIKIEEHTSPETDVVIEKFASYGMPAIGAECFETCFWTGRFIQKTMSAQMACFLVTRKTVTLHHCNHPRANDATVRAQMINRFGPSRREAVGLKASPGPIYGVKSHAMAALAVALFYQDKHEELGDTLQVVDKVTGLYDYPSD